MDTLDENIDDASEKRLNINQGHRKRLKARYANSMSFDSFAPHEVLEMLLFYVIPQKDTKAIAKELLAAFDNSLDNVLNADVEQLKKVKGIKEEASLFLTVFNRLEQYRGLHCRKAPEVLNKPEKVIEYLRPYYRCKKTEASMVICLDRECRPKGCYTIMEGTVNFTSLNPRRILEIVLKYDSPCVILSHNHPAGSPTPSQNDIETTRSIIRMLSQIEVKVLDHVILSPSGELSMANNSKYAMMFR